MDIQTRTTVVRRDLKAVISRYHKWLKQYPIDNYNSDELNNYYESMVSFLSCAFSPYQLELVKNGEVLLEENFKIFAIDFINTYYKEENKELDNVVELFTYIADSYGIRIRPNKETPRSISIENLLDYNLKEITNEWEISGMIHYMINSVYETDYMDSIDTIDVAKEGLIKVKEVFDNMHDSDECCYMNLVFYEDELVCIISKYGDKTDTNIDWKSKYSVTTMKEYFDTYISDNDHEDTRSYFNMDMPFHDLAYNGYNTIHKIDNDLYYTLDSPKWGSMKKPDLEQYIKEDGKMIPCKFIKYITNEPSYKDKICECIIEVDGKEREYKAIDIYFKMNK